MSQSSWWCAAKGVTPRLNCLWTQPMLGLLKIDDGTFKNTMVYKNVLFNPFGGVQWEIIASSSVWNIWFEAAKKLRIPLFRIVPCSRYQPSVESPTQHKSLQIGDCKYPYRVLNKKNPTPCKRTIFLCSLHCFLFPFWIEHFNLEYQTEGALAAS
jgi:hypothetical protein